jgi:hypothetical protein
MGNRGITEATVRVFMLHRSVIPWEMSTARILK